MTGSFYIAVFLLSAIFSALDYMFFTAKNSVENKSALHDMILTATLRLRLFFLKRVNGRGRFGGQTAGGHTTAFLSPGGLALQS